MFNSLYKLYFRNQGNKTPLEDFNTESFVGLLKSNPTILTSFIKFLKIDIGEYKIDTQVKYSLENDINCIVDIVLESVHTICFIECKVNSHEGWRQLDRYSKVLDTKSKQTKLIYLTKKIETKKIKKHNFKQYRWFQVANWLNENHIKSNLVQHYIHFLTQQQIVMDTTITTDTIVSLKHFLNTYEAMDFHIKEVQESFKQIFTSKVKIEKQEKIPYIRRHDRIARYIRNPLKDKSFHSEILYSIHFNDIKLQTQIWVHKSHPQCETIYEKGKESGLFTLCELDEFGLGLRVAKKLFHFIDDVNSDIEIKKWFKTSFEATKQFIIQTPDIEWDIDVK